MAATFSPSEFKMLLESFDYIKNNQEITTDQLPEVWVKFWSVPDFIFKPCYQPGSVQVLVFMFILRLHQEFKEEEEDVLNSFYFNRLFYDFQIILATIDYCRNYHLPIPAFPLFDVRKYSVPHLEDGEQLLRQYEWITGTFPGKDAKERQE